ncbi:MAG: hypothetical protein ACLRNQ_13735 [Flavonifractor plautii]
MLWPGRSPPSSPAPATFSPAWCWGRCSGEPLETAAQRAAEFVQRCATHTLALGTPVLEGVQFEPALGELMQR